MLGEKQVEAPLLIFDRHPDEISAKPLGDYTGHKTLTSHLSPGNALAQSNGDIGGDALTALNTARKLYWRHSNSTADVDRELVNTAYLNADDIWHYFYNTCDFGTRDTMEYRDAARAVTDTIEREVRDITGKE